MTYEVNPGGLGVGKRYGPLNLGGSNGKKGTFGSHDEAIFFITTEELSADAAQSIEVPPYSEVVSVWYKVTDSFGTGDTFTINMGGFPITLAVMPVDIAGIFDPALHGTITNIQTGAASEVLTLDSALINDGALGVAKVVVTIKQI